MFYDHFSAHSLLAKLGRETFAWMREDPGSRKKAEDSRLVPKIGQKTSTLALEIIVHRKFNRPHSLSLPSDIKALTQFLADESKHISNIKSTDVYKHAVKISQSVADVQQEEAWRIGSAKVSGYSVYF